MQLKFLFRDVVKFGVDEMGGLGCDVGIRVASGGNGVGAFLTVHGESVGAFLGGTFGET